MNFDVLRAIKRPFTDFNKFGVGVVLLMIPFVNLLVRGYKLESARTAMNKKFSMPKWENFGSLFLRGLLSWVIGIVYMLPAIIFIIIPLGKTLYDIILQYGLNQGLSLQNELSNQLIQNSLVQNASMMPIFALGILLALLAAYITPLAIVRYSEKYKFKSAFDFGIIFKKAFTGKYFLAVLVVIAYSIVISLIVSALNLGFSAMNINTVYVILSFIVGGLSGFMIMITSYTIFGEVYSKIK